MEQLDYFTDFKDVFQHYAVSDAQSAFEWDYQRQPFRVQCMTTPTEQRLTLAFISYDSEYRPTYHDCYEVTEQGGTFSKAPIEATANLPYDAKKYPELVLRCLLSVVQGVVRDRQRRAENV